MRAEEIRPVDLTTGAGYDSQWALMRDLFVWLDLRLYYFYAHHQWLGPASEMKNMLGLVVTREEFEHQLARSAQMGLEEELEPEESAQIGEAQAAIALRLGRKGGGHPAAASVRALRSGCVRAELRDIGVRGCARPQI